MPRADLLTGENAWGCLVALPPGLCSLPACVRPGLERRLSVPPTAAPATPPHRPPAGAEGERSPGICSRAGPPGLQPLPPPSTPTYRRTPALPIYLKGGRWPCLRRVSQRAPSRGGCPSNSSFIQSGDPGTSQLRPARSGEGQPVPHHKPRSGGTGGGGGKSKQSREPRLEPGTLQDGGTDVPYPPHRSGGTSPGGSCPLPPAAGVSSPAPSRRAAPLQTLASLL